MEHKNKNRPYTLEPYSRSWADQFKKIKHKITPWFGDNLISIEHVGSTAVACSDMIAKPNIDICVVVHNLSRLPNNYQNFTKNNYTILGESYVGDGGDYIVKDDPSSRIRTESIHIYQTDTLKPEQYCNFRDYLMTHADDRARYIACKQKLFNSHPAEYKKYDNGKTELIEELKLKATLWKQDQRT